MPVLSPRRLAPWLTALLVVTGLGAVTATPGSAAGLDPAAVRSAAKAAGLDSLATVAVPTPSNLDRFVVPTPEAHLAAQQLGKALFWDMQVGSDGQSCASCHFHAGADDRAKNQL